MKTELLNLFSFLLIVAYVTLLIHFGIYFDIQTIATFMVAAILSPILTYLTIQFVFKYTSHYFIISQKFTRNITLHIVDPLLC